MEKYISAEHAAKERNVPKSKKLQGFAVYLTSRDPDPLDADAMEALRVRLKQIVVESDQIGAPSGLDPAQGNPPARHAVGLFEVRAEAVCEIHALLGVEGFRSRLAGRST